RKHRARGGQPRGRAPRANGIERYAGQGHGIPRILFTQARSRGCCPGAAGAHPRLRPRHLARRNSGHGNRNRKHRVAHRSLPEIEPHRGSRLDSRFCGVRSNASEKDAAARVVSRHSFRVGWAPHVPQDQEPHLPQGAAVTRRSAVKPGDSKLAARLAGAIEGEVLFDAFTRGRYSTDASIYQVEPVGVIRPKSVADIEAALTIARDEGVPVTARGGGTSQAGQTINEALILDTSTH